MDFIKYKEVINKFSKKDVIDFLGEKLYSSLIEWSSDESIYTRSSLVDILVSINGYNLFLNKDFRDKFFSSIDINCLKDLLNSSSDDYEDLAKKASNIKFADNDFYNNLFCKYLNSPDFIFDTVQSEQMHEVISKADEKFYELLDYQYVIKEQALYELSKKLPYGRKILIHMPTGTGKTKTTMHILTFYFNFLSEKRGLVLWVAHTNELLKQAFETFKNVWHHQGLYDIDVEKSWGQGDYSINHGIVFISIQALQSMKNTNLDLYNSIKDKTNLMVYDECHKIGAEETSKIVDDFSKSTQVIKRNFVGLTATPGRTTDFSIENRKFSEFFDRSIEIDIPLVNRVSMEKNEAINLQKPSSVIRYFQDKNILAKLKKEELIYDTDPLIYEKIEKELRNKNEDFSKKLVETIANNKARNSVILKRLKELNSEGKPTIVFACSVAHAKMLSAFLNIEKIPNALVFGDMPFYLREKAINDFKDRNNPVNIIINFDILTTGFDSTNIQCVFITRPTKSVILYSQMIGRGLRGPQMGGNKECLLIDIKENLNSYDENEAFAHFNEYWR